MFNTSFLLPSKEKNPATNILYRQHSQREKAVDGCCDTASSASAPTCSIAVLDPSPPAPHHHPYCFLEFNGYNGSTLQTAPTSPSPQHLQAEEDNITFTVDETVADRRQCCNWLKA